MAAIAIIILSLVFYGGFRLGGYHMGKENNTLRNQLLLQEKFSTGWAAEATNKYTLSQNVAQQQTNNLQTNMNTVIQLLNTIQKEQIQTLNNEEQEKINQLIYQAKSITSP